MDEIINIPPHTPLSQIVDWAAFFEVVRRRAGVWIGCQSISRLRMFMEGFHFAEAIYNVPPDKCLNGFPFEEFEQWVESGFNPTRLSLNSYWLAEHVAASEEAAFHLWFSWYDQFRRERGLK